MANDVTVRAAETRSMIEKKWPEICKALPKHITPERMLRVVQNAFGKNPKLLECTPISLMGAIVLASELGLEPNTPLGLGYIIPYDESTKIDGAWKKVKNAQFQLGYRGLMDLAYRSGKVRSIAAEVVYSNDEFKRTLGLHRDLIHIPAAGDRGEPVGYYATVCIDGADPAFAYMTYDEAREHGLKFSKAFAYDVKEGKKSSPWSTNFDAMALKTAIIKALKYAPKAIEDASLRRAIEMDTDDAIDVTARGVNLDPHAGAQDDPRKDLAEACTALITEFKDKIPGGVTMDDIEALIGGSMATAPVEDVCDGIQEARTKANGIAGLKQNYPDYVFPKRPMEMEVTEVDAIWAELYNATNQKDSLV